MVAAFQGITPVGFLEPAFKHRQVRTNSSTVRENDGRIGGGAGIYSSGRAILNHGDVVKDNMGWSGWEEFRNLTPNDKTNLQEQE